MAKKTINRYEHYHGYQPDFLGEHLRVDLPKFDEETIEEFAPLKSGKGFVLDYVNYSVIQHAYRKFPILTAANIDGEKIKAIPRRKIGNNWKLDKRIRRKHQMGSELYRAALSDFDKGHMTKREDVQWGDTDEQAALAAKSTFFYTNAVPQHAKLNQRAWQAVENYILHSEAVTYDVKINMFTGPLLDATDPDFVTPIDEDFIQLPTLFWKVVYFSKDNKNLSRVSFLYGQKDLLEGAGIVPASRAPAPIDDIFMDFEDAKTYQVTTSVLEQLAGFSFPEAEDPYTDDRRPLEMIVEEVSVRGLGGSEIQLPNLVF